MGCPSIDRRFERSYRIAASNCRHAVPPAHARTGGALVRDRRTLPRAATFALVIGWQDRTKQSVASIGDCPHGGALRTSQIRKAPDGECRRDLAAFAIRTTLSVHSISRKQQSSRHFCDCEVDFRNVRIQRRAGGGLTSRVSRKYGVSSPALTSRHERWRIAFDDGGGLSVRVPRSLVIARVLCGDVRCAIRGGPAPARAPYTGTRRIRP